MRSYVDKIVGWMLSDDYPQPNARDRKIIEAINNYGRVIHPFKQKELREKIAKRLATEDYARYLPAQDQRYPPDYLVPKKPRVRYKLRTRYIVRSAKGVRYTRFGWNNRKCVWK